MGSSPMGLPTTAHQLHLELQDTQSARVYFRGHTLWFRLLWFRVTHHTLSMLHISHTNFNSCMHALSPPFLRFLSP